MEEQTYNLQQAIAISGYSRSALFTKLKHGELTRKYRKGKYKPALAFFASEIHSLRDELIEQEQPV